MPIDPEQSMKKVPNAVSRRGEFAKRIGTALQARAELLGRSARDVSIKATGSPDSIRCIIAGSMPAADRYSMLAHELGIDPDRLLRSLDVDGVGDVSTNAQTERAMDVVMSLWRRAMNAARSEMPDADQVEVAHIAASLVRTAVISRSTTKDETP